MAMVDAKSPTIISIDVGCEGHIADGGVFAGCSLPEVLSRRVVDLPSEALMTTRLLCPIIFLETKHHLLTGL